MWFYLAVLGVFILLVLSITAIVLWVRVYKQQKNNKLVLAQIEAGGNKKLAEYRVKQNKDLQIVAQALLKEELSFTEASLRIAAVLEQLNINETSFEQLAPLFELRKKTSHIPILKEWSYLTDKEQRIFDKERLRAESELSGSIITAAKFIIGRDF